MKKLISIVIPAYNEEDCVDELAARLKTLFATESQYDFEAIIVENGSIDSTWEKLKKIGRAKRCTSAIVHHNHFSQNPERQGKEMDEVYQLGYKFIDADRKILEDKLKQL